MSSAYWNQWDCSEILSMHGVEADNDCDDDCDDIDICQENDEDIDRCPRCSGGGCNYCLMLEW